MKNLIKIYNDCYFIANRLKEIDKSYEIYYNLNRNCYEVHSNQQAKSSYCFTVPFRELDERTLDYAIKTLSTNRDKIIKEIEENNRLVTNRNMKNQVNALKEIICL